jgi:hypothetical protein
VQQPVTYAAGGYTSLLPNRTSLAGPGALPSSGSASSGGGGHAVIEVRPQAGYEARIIEQSVELASIKVLNDTLTDSSLSQAMKQLTR